MSFLKDLKSTYLFQENRTHFLSARTRQKVSRNMNTAASLLLRRPFPLWAYILLTRRCNLPCSYCYVTKAKFKQFGLKGASEEMTLTQLKQAIDKLFELGTRWVSFFGGEPTIRRNELIGSIEYASIEKGMFTQLPTNGLFLKDESYVDDLGSAGIDLVDVSLDSLARFDASRKDFYHRQGVFETLFEGRKKYGYAIKTNFVLTKVNIDQLVPVMNFAHLNHIMLSIRLVFKPPVRPLGWKEEENLYFDKTRQDVRLVDEAVNTILKKKAAGYVTCEPNELYDAMRKYVRGQPALWKCDAGKYHLTINNDGTIMQCAVLLDMLPMHVSELDDRYFEKIEARVKKNLAICNDHCLATAYFCSQHYRTDPISFFEQGFL